MLVGLRLWAGYWKHRRSTLLVKGDSVTALTLVMHCRAAPGKMTIIARELALDIAECVYRPDLVVHIPGVNNISADRLSRLHDQHKPATVPAFLSSVRRAEVPIRDSTYYRALLPPAATQTGETGPAVVH